MKMNGRNSAIKMLGLMALLTFWLATDLRAQMQLAADLSGDELVEGYLIGDKVRIKEVLVKGSPDAIGLFESVKGMPHFSKGMVLSTGKATDIASANDNPKLSTLNEKGGDRYLDGLSNNRTFDAVSVEFDLMCARDSLSLRFFFGSDEYNEYVGNTFGDVFGIWITGPGLGRGVNLAKLDSGEPISVNSVNYNKNRQYYLDNNPFNLNGRRHPPAEAKLDKTVLNAFQFDGYTTVFERGIKVKPKETYHIKIAIADAGDGTLDSGVFLEAGSLQSEEQLWRIRRREEMERQRIADSIAAVRAYEDSIRVAKYIADSIRQVQFEDSLRAAMELLEEENQNSGTGELENNSGTEDQNHNPGSEEPVDNWKEPDFEEEPPNSTVFPAGLKKFQVEFKGTEIEIPSEARLKLRNLAGHLESGKFPNRDVEIFLHEGDSGEATLRLNSVKYYLIGAGLQESRIHVNENPPSYIKTPDRSDWSAGPFLQIMVTE